ncbi:hypothetical protein [Candidatus Frankia alpina]|uniref:Uncharacterized protein n=1 Tax=Candidatus Frankia alpina TaxID=2699483 RepID=A0A4V3Z062_9ACTN|nr:hypothetical protein [Candidatus Frankia alpina]THJ45702.1 hypothetical protein E7Y31_19775 [Candidatus Frankia alpina]
MVGHADPVRALVALPLASGRTLLASAGDYDGTVRLWDPTTGRPVDTPFSGRSGSVNALTAVPLSGGRTLLASAGQDGAVLVWAPAASGTPPVP